MSRDPLQTHCFGGGGVRIGLSGMCGCGDSFLPPWFGSGDGGGGGRGGGGGGGLSFDMDAPGLNARAETHTMQVTKSHGSRQRTKKAASGKLAAFSF